MSLIHQALEKGPAFSPRFSLAAALSSVQKKASELDAWVARDRQKTVPAVSNKRAMVMNLRRFRKYAPVILSVLAIYFLGLLSANLIKTKVIQIDAESARARAVAEVPVLKTAVQQPAAVSHRRGVSASGDAFVLSGIIEGAQPIAVINGELLQKGDRTLDGKAVITDIQKNTVLLESSGRQLSLSL